MPLLLLWGALSALPECAEYAGRSRSRPNLPRSRPRPSGTEASATTQREGYEDHRPNGRAGGREPRIDRGGKARSRKEPPHRGAHVASICTGVFLLAETGLLDGRAATLHWGFTGVFKSRYPQVTLKPDEMFRAGVRMSLRARWAAKRALYPVRSTAPPLRPAFPVEAPGTHR